VVITPPGNGARRTPPSTVWATTAAGGVALLLIAAATTAMSGDRPRPRDFGVTSLSAARVPPTSGPPRSRNARAASPRASRTVSAPIPPAAPTVVTIPVLGVQALVQPVGTSNAELDVPPDPAQVGWWTGSARVGATKGTVVIDGHVDSAATGPGALFRLQDLHASDQIVIATTIGQRQTYLVTGRRVYVKANGLPPELFTTTGPHRLVLITCGGPFDPTTGGYLDNVVVFAAPT
jgi:Sortase domain